MRSSAPKRTLAILVCASALTPWPSSADLASCLNDTGYALSEINSADAEDGLGMDPPQLDVVPVPEPDARALRSVGLGVLLALRARDPRRFLAGRKREVEIPYPA